MFQDISQNVFNFIVVCGISSLVIAAITIAFAPYSVEEQDVIRVLSLLLIFIITMLLGLYFFSLKTAIVSAVICCVSFLAVQLFESFFYPLSDKE